MTLSKSLRVEKYSLSQLKIEYRLGGDLASVAPWELIAYQAENLF
ncbi:hypothetical protein DSM110093_01706 [Sulfitobacter sp. DSM 110093]|nr:hypothetical protein DSM110093_01706 [Sulfitobacter sp. DSM 110093]